MSGRVEVLDAVLLGVVVVTAFVAVLVPRRRAAVAAFLVFGILLAVLWARLGAPDIAIAEAVLGGGITGALLVDALSPGPPTVATRSRTAPWTWAGIAAAAALTAALVLVVRRLGEPAGDLPHLVERHLPDSGAEHPVTAVLLNFRSFDTLVEIAVVMVAALAATAVGDGRWARRIDASPDLRRAGALLVPVTLLLAGWLLVAGTSRPGGAFQAGAVVAAGLLVAYLTGAPHLSTRGRGGELLVVLGTVGFVLVAIATAIWAGGWLTLPPAWASGIVLALETVLAASIGVGLGRIFLANRRAGSEPR